LSHYDQIKIIILEDAIKFEGFLSVFLSLVGKSRL